MSQTYTKEDTAKRYDSARALPAEALTLAMETLQNSLPLSGSRAFSILALAPVASPNLCQETFTVRHRGRTSEAMLTQGKSRRFDNIEWRQVLQRTSLSVRIPLTRLDVQVFHHLEDPVRAFQEMRRVLVSRGCLAIRNGTRENETP